MKKVTSSLRSIFIACCSVMLVQCSSSRKSAGAATIPDVSQIPTDSDTAADKQEKTTSSSAVMFGSPEFYLPPDTSRHYDSIKTTAVNRSPRILHISATDFSVYDTPLDSAGKKTKSHSLDSTDYDYNVDVGILSPSNVQSLTLKLSETEIVALSLVNKELFENFEKEDFEKKFAQYGARYVLLTVAQSDSKMRSTFVIQFYQQRLSGKTVEKAFRNALDDAKHLNGVIDFKATLIKNR